MGEFGAIREGFAAVGVYEELGVKPFINTIANHTRFGGAIMPAVVVEAMAQAAKQSVNIYELQEAAGQAIARMTKNEACYISCGAASGLQLAVAACMTGTDEALARRLPSLGGDFNVVMQRSQRGTEADTAIRNTGASLRLAGDDSGTTIDQIAAAFDQGTAAVVALDWEGGRWPRIAEIASTAHERRVPLIVDAADGVPPVSNFWRYTRDWGADAVAISGGKGLRGPQNTGLVLGSRKIVQGCTFLGCPNDRFGRTMKVSKEAMVGIHAAVKHFLESERDAVQAASREADLLVRELSRLRGVAVQLSQGEVIVRLHRPDVSDDQVRTHLLDGQPAILGFCRAGTLRVNAALLQPGLAELISQRLREVLD